MFRRRGGEERRQGVEGVGRGESRRKEDRRRGGDEV